ncbi:MAG TPA: VanZ family protein [Phycisphaerales bacterium]|nr:VanZ family protein [Phycisphaerales bacterium]
MTSLADRLVRYRKTLRVLFWVFAGALFVGTHWPALRIDVPMIRRPDLVVHFVIFAAWFGLFWLTAYVGEPLRLRSILLAVVVACVYAGVDEGLQAIPWVRRTCAWDDYAANCVGVALGAFAALVATLVSTTRAARATTSDRHPVPPSA